MMYVKRDRDDDEGKENGGGSAKQQLADWTL